MPERGKEAATGEPNCILTAGPVVLVQGRLQARNLRRHGPFESARLPLVEMEYTTMPQVLERLKDRFEPVD